MDNKMMWKKNTNSAPLSQCLAGDITSNINHKKKAGGLTQKRKNSNYTCIAQKY